MLKTLLSFISLLAISLLVMISCSDGKKRTGEPWTEEQLMPTSELAEIINNNNNLEGMYLFSIGPAGMIKGSVEFGSAQESDNLEHLRKGLSGIPKNAEIVLYCGCCPFEDCPNIRPAFDLLNEMGFTDHKLLNLSQNLKVDWIDKGYPTMD